MKVSHQDCLYVCHYIIQQNKVKNALPVCNFSSLPWKKLTYALHILKIAILLKTVQHLHSLAQHLIGKFIWKNENQGSASRLLPVEPIQAQKLLLRTVGALHLDMLCRNKARELKSIDAVCGHNCRMESASPWFFQVILKSVKGLALCLTHLENSTAQN